MINYLITLFLTPYITDEVGTEAYGFVSLAKNIAQYATYVTMALNSFATRFISVEYHKKNIDKANVYFSSTYYGDVVLGLGVFALSVLGILNLNKIFNIPDGILKDVQILFLLVFIRFFIVTVASVNESGPMISNKLYLSGIYRLCSYLTEGTVLFILFHTFHANLFYVGAAMLAAALIEVFSNYWIRKKYTPELEIRKSSFRGSAVKELVGNGIWTSINSLGSFLHSGLDLTVCNLMLDSFQMGQLAISETMSLMFKSIYTLVSTPFQPLLLKSYADGDTDGLIRQFKLSMKISSMLSNICFAGVFALGLSYYRLWIPNQDIDLIWKLTMISIIACVTGGIVYPLYFSYTLTLRKKVPCMMTLISGAMNVISMYFLIKYTSLGIYAVVWTTVVLTGALYLVAHPLYVSHVLNVRKYTFYPVILRCVVSCIALTGIYYALSKLYMPKGWLSFFITAFAYALIGAPIHVLLTFDARERGRVKEAVRKIIRK